MMQRNGKMVNNSYLNTFILVLKWLLFEPKMFTVQWDLETYILAPLGLQNWSLVCPKIDSKSVKLAAKTTSPSPT